MDTQLQTPKDQLHHYAQLHAYKLRRKIQQSGAHDCEMEDEDPKGNKQTDECQNQTPFKLLMWRRKF